MQTERRRAGRRLGVLSLVLACAPGRTIDDPRREPAVCPETGRFDHERVADDDIALVDDLLYSKAGMTLDLYVPDAALEPCGTRPLLVMVHGGAWIKGRKEWLEARARFHARHGLVVATIDYRETDQPRLCGGDGWDRAAYRAMQDVHAAIETLVGDADTYAIDPAAVFLYGNSAGAMTTLSLAVTSEGTVERAFPDIVAGEGPLDAQSLRPEVEYDIRAIHSQAGAILDDSLVDPMAAPPDLLLMQSRHDTLVPYAVGGSSVCPNDPLKLYGSSWVSAVIDIMGGCAVLVEVEGGQHDLDRLFGQRCVTGDPPCEPSRLDATADRFFSAVLDGTCDSQHSYCTTSGCRLVEDERAAPREWFTLFP